MLRVSLQPPRLQPIIPSILRGHILRLHYQVRRTNLLQVRHTSLLQLRHTKLLQVRHTNLLQVRHTRLLQVYHTLNNPITCLRQDTEVISHITLRPISRKLRSSDSRPYLMDTLQTTLHHRHRIPNRPATGPNLRSMVQLHQFPRGLHSNPRKLCHMYPLQALLLRHRDLPIFRQYHQHRTRPMVATLRMRTRRGRR